MRSYLYVIGPKAGPVKIGISVAPEACRLPQIQTGHPKKLFLIAQKPGGPAEELAVHTFLAMWRMEGEWFRRSHEVKAFIDLLGGGCSVTVALAKMQGLRAQWWDDLRLQEAARVRDEVR